MIAEIEMVELVMPAVNLLRLHAQERERAAFGIQDKQRKATAIGIARGISMAASALDELAHGKPPRSLGTYVDPLEAL